MDIDGLLYKADKASDDGEIEEAKDILLEILSEEPKCGQAYNHLGWLYKTKFNDPIRAEKYYKLAIQFAPEYPASYINYIYLLRDRGSIEELEKMLDRAKEIKAVSKATLFDEYGTLYELKKDYTKAIEYYQKAITYSISDSHIEDLKKHINRCIDKRRLFAGNRFKRAIGTLLGKY